MGRSPFFSFSKVAFPAERPESAATLETLQKGQRVRIRVQQSSRAHRSPSNYGYATSSLYAPELIVDHIDIEPELAAYGVRAIAFRDARISGADHKYIWYVTTDGYVRECEHFGIMHMIESIELL